MFIVSTLLYQACSIIIIILVILSDRESMVEYPSENTSWLKRIKIFSDDFYIEDAYIYSSIAVIAIIGLCTLPIL